jgi:hypothetical protein
LNCKESNENRKEVRKEILKTALQVSVKIKEIRKESRSKVLSFKETSNMRSEVTKINRI